MKQKSLIVRQGFSEEESGFLECRGREIRTPDLLLPKQARYRRERHTQCIRKKAIHIKLIFGLI